MNSVSKTIKLNYCEQAIELKYSHSSTTIDFKCLRFLSVPSACNGSLNRVVPQPHERRLDFSLNESLCVRLTEDVFSIEQMKTKGKTSGSERKEKAS